MAPAVTGLALGDEYGCALDTGEAVVCWGSPKIDKGQTMPPSRKFKHLRGYKNSNCAFDSGNTFECWGEVFGYAKGSKAIDIGLGERHRCLLLADATVTCVGDPGAAEALPPDGAFLSVAAGSGLSCAIRENHTLVCWGSDVFHGLDVPSGSFSRVSVGGGHQCAIRMGDDSVACWGAGVATDPNGMDPEGRYFGQAIPPTGSFGDICAGYRHSCGVRTDGTLACWGLGTKIGDCVNAGECGQAAPPGGKFVEVDCGLSHTCGIKEDGTVACWGSNNADRSTPPADLKIF